MALRRPTYDVQLDPNSDELVRVVVTLADQLVAEREAPRHDVPLDPSLAPQHTAALWVWCAARRQVGNVGTFADFTNTAVFEPVVDERTQEAQVQGVDPTRPEAPTLAS